MMHVVSTFFYHDCLNVPPTANNQTVVVYSMKQTILCLTVIPEKLVLLRCPLRASKIVEVVYVKFSSLNSPSIPASAAALEFKVEFSFKSKQLKTVKWCLTSHNHMYHHNNINYTTVYHTYRISLISSRGYY